MARKRNSSSRSGGMLFGLLFGVILGLAAAVAVAFFVTNAPVPFLDKASRAPDQGPLANVREAPDPNLGLTDRTSFREAQAEPVASPNDAARASMTQDIDQLIASLSQGQQGQIQQTPRTGSSPPTAANAQTQYYLQTGAFRSESEAEALKARILMLGLDSFVQSVQVDGALLHRVRVGPFRGIDEMNRSRIVLGKSSIPSEVVRP